MKSMLLFFGFILLLVMFNVDSKKISRSRSSGSSRGSSGRTSYKPAPTSFSYPQPSAPKPTLFGWQEKPAQKSQILSSWQSKPASGQSHSYPSSQTGLSGNNQPKQTAKHEENIQRNIPSQNSPAQRPLSNTNSQPSHSYPSSNGLSGNSGGGYPSHNSNGLNQQPSSGHQQVQGHHYPQNQGNNLSGSGIAPPPYQGYKPVDANRPYNGGYQNTNYGSPYQHPQGPPPPYSTGYNYGGYGSYNPGYASQMPGYFGSYGKGLGGTSRTGSALTGVGIAGAGVGTLLTGLALWNLARSSGHSHHTVIYDNRGQPVAVAPANDTAVPVDPMLANLVNCSLTISNDNATEILSIPCAIATSFSSDATAQEVDSNKGIKDNTKCTVTVLTKTGKEYMTTIPCSILLNTAAENNVTEPPLLQNETKLEDATNSTTTVHNNSVPEQPVALKLVGGNTDDINNNYTSNNCTPEMGDVRDPINSCFSVVHNLTVIPLIKTSTTNVVDNN